MSRKRNLESTIENEPLYVAAQEDVAQARRRVQSAERNVRRAEQYVNRVVSEADTEEENIQGAYNVEWIDCSSSMSQPLQF